MAICEYCGDRYDAFRASQRFCGSKCRKNNQKNGQTKSLRYRDGITKYQPKPKPVLITNTEQKKIDQEVFLKTALTYESRCYKPGYPEFDKIASTVTKLDKIPKERYHFHRFHRDGQYHFVKEEG